ncbi:hypothetical protein GN316_00665 [Xylophilus sp. Kf1]|nr:hypothetical protein [Xylophilus sp. Kf1]
MKNIRIAAAVMALTLGVSTLASAQPRDGRDDRDGRRGGPPHAQQMQRGGPDRGGPHRGGHDRGRPGFDRHDGHGAGPDHRFYRGDRLPPQYRSRQYVVEDWRGHRLSAPPRGQQWVQVGGDYVLAAIATGVITALILNN